MPTMLMGSLSGDSDLMGEPKNISYEYAKGIDISPDSKLSNRIIKRIVANAEDSFSKMSQRHKKWNEIDDTLKVYIKADDYEKALKKEDARRPVSIVVPYSYATLETIMAYLTKAFLGESIFQYDGVGPEDTIPAKLLELTANQQVRRFKSDLEMHTSMRDSLSYGFGASTVVWSEVWGKKTVMEEKPIYNMWGDAIGANKIKANQDALLFEGNETIAIDPYRFLPDPNVSIHNIQSGDFCGWIEFQSYNKLLSDENTGNGLVNVKWLRTGKYVNMSSKYSTDSSSRISKRDNNNLNNQSRKNYVTLIHMYVQVIPKEWDLPPQDGNPNGEYPEVWLFTVANENLVIRAMPLGLNHNKFPIAISAPDFDGYSITPLSRMELVDGLQTTLNWMFNSHIANVRKAINDMLIVDPSLINMEDMENPEPGKLIRLRRSAWGRGVENAVKQLAVNDITRNNMNDAEQIMGLMQKATAATDATMGVQRTGGERVTAQEYSGTMQMAVSRLEHIARMTSRQYITDLAYFHASHTQQLMSKDIYDKAIGQWPDVLMEEFGNAGIDPAKPMKIDPFSVLCDFDVIFKDGTTTTADALSNAFWTQNFQAILASDKLGMFDVTKIFRHMARINGAKNVGDFINKGGGVFGTLMQNNQSVLEQKQAGNLVPLDEAASGMPAQDGGGSAEQDGMGSFF
jgi:hypothetical protein